MVTATRNSPSRRKSSPRAKNKPDNVVHVDPARFNAALLRIARLAEHDRGLPIRRAKPTMKGNTMSLTLAQSIQITGKTVLDHLDHTADVPRIDTTAAQGDVLIHRVTTQPATTPMPNTVIVVQSEASTNTHTLHPNGTCYYDPHTPNAAGDLVVGTLTVPDDSTALLSHQEHGNIEILPGTYQLRRQREFAGEWRMVAD